MLNEIQSLYEELRLKPTKASKYGSLLRLSIKKHPNESDLAKKIGIQKKILQFLGLHTTSLGVPVSQLLEHLLKIASMSPLI